MVSTFVNMVAVGGATCEGLVAAVHWDQRKKVPDTFFFPPSNTAVARLRLPRWHFREGQDLLDHVIVIGELLTLMMGWVTPW